jgi:hypothetical protein
VDELTYEFPGPFGHQSNCGWCHDAGYTDFNETTWHVVIGKTLWTSTAREVS